MKRAHLKFNKDFDVSIGNKRSQAAQMTIAAGESEGGAGNYHRGADQWLFVVSGTGLAIVNRKRYRLSAGSLVLIERGDRHEIRAGRTGLNTLNVYVPPAYNRSGEELPAARPA